MSRFSIRNKVIAVIAFMLIAMSGLGLLAVRSMQAINAHTVEIADNWLPSIRVLGELRADINLFRIALRAHVMAETPEAKAANDKRLAGILDNVAKDRKKHEALLSSPEERALHENWARAWERYMTGVQEVIEASRASIGRIPHEASELISKKVAVIAAESDESLTKSIDLNNTGAETATKDAAEGYNFAFYVVMSIVLAAIAAGVVVGFYLVPRPLARDRVDREADAGARQRRAFGRSPASRGEHRDRCHGRYAAGIQAGADRQESR